MLKTALIVAAAAVAPASASIYLQASDRPNQPSFFSDAVAGQFFSQRMADNFTLDSDAEATAIRWWGGSQNFQFEDIVNMISYTVVIYASDEFGEPDTANILYQSTNGLGSADLDAVATGASLLNGGIEYAYTLNLEGPLALTAGTQYWISVGATLALPGGDAWVWSGSSTGDLVNASDFFNGSGYTVFDPTFNDLAFEIIPTPGSTALLALAGLTAIRRRRD
jgi:hypothetical protein